MLEGDDLLLPSVEIGVVMDRRLEDLFHPWQPHRVIDLDLRRQIRAIVEGADGDFQRAGLAVGQRRAAAGAEATVDVDRGLEIARLLMRPLDTVLRHRHQRAEEGAELFLAHAAMADGRAAELAAHAKADGAALATAGSNFIGHGLSSGGHCSVSWSG